MTPDNFLQSLPDAAPPRQLSHQLQALWFDGKGNWEKAHQLVQDETDATSALIHAYLHRKEGDTWNADYWYRMAGRTRPSKSLAAEWQDLVAELLAVS